MVVTYRELGVIRSARFLNRDSALSWIRWATKRAIEILSAS